MILIFNLNFVESDWYVLRKVFENGETTDFSQKWYETVGPALVNMIIINKIFGMLWKFVEIILYEITKASDIVKDGDRVISKSRSMHDYLAVHLGPDFQLDYSLASLMGTVSLVLLYGPAFPILYPITLAILIFEYASERILLCYYYREPATYDATMTRKSIVVI
jgi:hypothetical protein